MLSSISTDFLQLLSFSEKKEQQLVNDVVLDSENVYFLVRRFLLLE